MVIFFLIFEIITFCFDVDIYDLVHDDRGYVWPVITANSHGVVCSL